ncbi:DUF5677 domain-containing protein [Gracilibacillus caseinilyticus]|uniref:DUF5677 domain-containing protein n=1 Tax=Gracilibacillus caseinilyticus TaxID=2932256 RepID=A0ABY4EUW1_9BACI|nr:DUF5677 domain-containing protein [Gracilibacillus caseinilyticus]UOQ47765.1 DUF5677 domain-containing protein [Gracilibacillus caseinilyticus]
MKILKKVLKEANESVEKVIVKSIGENNQEFDFPEAITLGLFEDMVKKIESMILLIENKQDASIDTIARSVMENYVYLKVLLSDNNELLAQSYFVSKKYKEFKLYEMIKMPGKKGNEIRRLLDNPNIDEMDNEANILNEDDLKEKYPDVFNKRFINQKWYNIDGKTKNFEQLCKKQGLQAEYEIMYKLLSNEVHSMDALKRWEFEENQVHMVYSNKGLTMHIHMVGLFLLETIRRLYEFYGLKEDLNTFNTLIRVNYLISKKYK